MLSYAEAIRVQDRKENECKGEQIFEVLLPLLMKEHPGKWVAINTVNGQWLVQDEIKVILFEFQMNYGPDCPGYVRQIPRQGLLSHTPQ